MKKRNAPDQQPQTPKSAPLSNFVPEEDASDRAVLESPEPKPAAGTDEILELIKLRDDVVALLDANPGAVRVRECDGPEDVAASLALLLDARLLPSEITNPIAEVLSFDFGDVPKIAARFRANGTPIAERFEAEHAFVVWWLLGFALKYGEKWKENAAAQLPRLPKK